MIWGTGSVMHSQRCPDICSPREQPERQIKESIRLLCRTGLKLLRFHLSDSHLCPRESSTHETQIFFFFLINDILHALLSPSSPPPLPSFGLLLSNSILVLCSCTHSLLLLLLLARAAPSTRCHSEEEAVTRAATRGPGRRGGRSRGIVVIIIQMRRAKLELCPSPSGWLTVTNSSLIHPNHQLYTGQRRPERQGEAECIPTAAPRLIPSHRRPPSVSVRQEAARHRACSRCCSARTSWLWPRGSG